MYSLKQMKEEYRPVPVKKADPKDQQWLRDAKFGMFIHFGLYSVLGHGEWAMFNERISVSEYAKLANQFTLENFNAEDWVICAKNAGMKYMVLTTRHHDGFSLYDSKVSAYNSVNSAAKRDIVREYVEACRKHDMKIGFYYSPMDWRYPGYFFPEMYLDNALDMRDQCREQLRELMTNYGKIDMLWFDGEWLAHGGIGFSGDGWTRDPDYGNDPIYFKVNYFWESEKVLSMIRELQPHILINNRFGWEGDFHTRERRIGELRTDKPWESGDCLTRSWGWMPNMPMYSLRECIKKLVSVAVRDGTYLLNVGPTGKGNFESRCVERLRQVGEWLKQYGDAIYETRGGPVIPGEWGGSTYKSNQVYIHITEWQEDQIVIPSFSGKISSWMSLNTPNVTLIQKDDQLSIQAPVADRDPFDTIIKITLQEEVVWDGVMPVENDIYGLGDGLSNT